ncbi:photosystem II 5 kDa protein, chloroplastic-like [Musa acuminata AAA Group]|uniref:photosystem II 5 kDa protein, chloroplastic-like n=1 Tax=Musa acuminata AAA Group TaxID=214697 RepID=UPI0031D975F7
MASLTMMASFLSGAASVADRASSNRRRSAMVAKAAAKTPDAAKPGHEARDDGGSAGRRAVMFAAAAAAVCAVGGRGIAVAEEEPKAGTLEAKKKYAPICVTMPTARICRR